jgi:hypothetical protein
MSCTPQSRCCGLSATGGLGQPEEAEEYEVAEEGTVDNPAPSRGFFACGIDGRPMHAIETPKKPPRIHRSNGRFFDFFDFFGIPVETAFAPRPPAGSRSSRLRPPLVGTC